MLVANHFSPLSLASINEIGQQGPIETQSTWRVSAPNQSTTSEELQPASVDPNMVMADTLDYYGYWKLFDGLYGAAFYGVNREFALGNTPQQRFMGKWSDGTPVKELEILPYSEK